MKIIDISKEIFSAPVYPGDTPPSLEFQMDMKNGDDWNLTTLTAGLHTATHADAFMHFIEDGADIAQMPLEHYVGPAYVLEVVPGRIDAETIKTRVPEGTERLLIKGNGEAALSPEAARYIAECGIITLGTDDWSPAAPDDETVVHQILFENAVAILESLELSEVNTGEYWLFAPPIKISGAEGAFVRALLLEGMQGGEI